MRFFILLVIIVSVLGCSADPNKNACSKSTEADFNRVLDYINKDKDYKSARLLINKILPKNENCADVIAFDSILFGYENKFDKALVRINRSIELEPEEIGNYSTRATIYYKLKKYKLSNADIMKVIESGKGDNHAFIRLGINYYFMHEFKEAEKHLLKALSMQEDYEPTLYYLYSVYEQTGEEEKMKKYLVRCLQVKSKYHEMRKRAKEDYKKYFGKKFKEN